MTFDALQVRSFQDAGMTTNSTDLRRTSRIVAGPEGAGFTSFGSSDGGPWRRRDSPSLEYRIVRSLAELEHVEALQREVFGVTDLDLMAASMLIVLAETGGDVLAVYDLSDKKERLAGFVTAIGGFIYGQPRLNSDMMAIHSAYRSRGIGESLKRLQGCIALARGFVDVSWTVDPLRAANARLNFGKLGAYADRYERNRYGESYGSGLYGGMPTDRLHVIWPVQSARVQSVLAGEVLPSLATARSRAVTLPTDIDDLVLNDPDAALKWRFAVRETLENAFAEGLVVGGFDRTAKGEPALILTSGLDTATNRAP